MARQPLDLLVGLPLGGDVLLHVDPSAAGERLVGDADHPAIVQVLDFLAVPVLGEPGDVLLDPVGDAASADALSPLTRRMW